MVIDLFRVRRKQLLETIYAILAREAPCQQPDDYGGEVDYDDHDSFMTLVCNLVGTFDRMMRLHFVKAEENERAGEEGDKAGSAVIDGGSPRNAIVSAT